MRIYTSKGEPLDFCLSCVPSEEEAIKEHGDLGNGPDDRGNCFDFDSDHPPYDECDYSCHTCNEKLVFSPPSF